MAKPKFFQRDSLFESKNVSHDVGGNTLQFYPISTKMLWRMRRFVEPVANAFRILASVKNDFERTVDEGLDEETGEKRTITHMGAVKPELAKLREDSSSEAFKAAFDAVFDEAAREFLGQLLTDSLRDEFTREEARSSQNVTEVMDSLDAATLFQMVHGVVKANMSVFGPFQERIRELADEKLGDLIPMTPSSPNESEKSESDEFASLEQQEQATAESGQTEAT